MSGQPRGRVMMVQGTASHAGKSVLVAALCRIFAQDGYNVAPFKAQNMSLNSFVTPDGCEIGRAQAVQAEAARVVPTADMNPILLKPEADNRSQVVVMGKPLRLADAQAYYAMKLSLWPVVTAALDRLRREFDLVVIEGAGSPAEINLREHEIVNMRVARYAEAPVLLVGDIERGGVFAALVGTLALLEPEEAKLIKAFVVNKFRGDASLLEPGLAMLQQRTGIPVAGVLPFFTDIAIPEEDSVALDDRAPPERAEQDRQASLDIAVVRLPHMANFDDFDPLRQEPAARVRYVASPRELEPADLVIIPGSKSTIADLCWLQERGLAQAIVDRRRAGTPVIGICGGYQMLGRRLLDPGAVESPITEATGLGLLPVTTRFASHKATHQAGVTVVRGEGMLEGCAGLELSGYEIHMGRTEVEPGAAPFRVTRRSGQADDAAEGCLDPQGLALGTYLHGLFHNDALRRAVLQNLAGRRGITVELAQAADPHRQYDKLASLVRAHLDMKLVYALAGREG